MRRSVRLRRTKRMMRALLERSTRRVLSRVHISLDQTRPGQHAAYRQRCTRKPRIRSARLQCRFLSVLKLLKSITRERGNDLRVTDLFSFYFTAIACKRLISTQRPGWKFQVGTKTHQQEGLPRRLR